MSDEEGESERERGREGERVGESGRERESLCHYERQTNKSFGYFFDLFVCCGAFVFFCARAPQEEEEDSLSVPS